MAHAYIHDTAIKLRSVRVVKTGDTLTLWEMPTNAARAKGVKWVMQINAPGYYTGQKATTQKAKANEMLGDIDAAIRSGAAVDLLGA